MSRPVCGAAMAALVVGAAAGGAAGQPRVVNMYVFDFDYSVNLPGQPIEDAVIGVGDIIRWVPLDEFHNTVAAVGQAEFWESEILSLDDTFEWVFDVPGVYQYYCSPHGSDNGDGTVSGMSGTITVLPGPGAAVVAGLAAVVAGGRRRR